MPYRLVPLTRHYWGELIKEGEVGRACSTRGGRPEDLRRCTRPRCRRAGNIKVDLKDIVSKAVAEDRDMLRAVVNTAMNSWVA
jgi:hypothetical protein